MPHTVGTGRQWQSSTASWTGPPAEAMGTILPSSASDTGAGPGEDVLSRSEATGHSGSAPEFHLPPLLPALPSETSLHGRRPAAAAWAGGRSAARPRPRPAKALQRPGRPQPPSRHLQLGCHPH